MGVFQLELVVGYPQGERYEKVDALVDSGATYTMLPSSILREFGVEPIEIRNFIVADDRHLQRGIGQTWVKIDGRPIICPVIFGDDNAVPLFGGL